ncbi:MAG TPA: hypothetical protein ENK18_07240 [Deltaproteobacteria bacterium]|nr:hypothetical protein [Deltaproteobacteria bacterium]
MSATALVSAILLSQIGCGTDEASTPPGKEATTETPRPDLDQFGWISEVVLEPGAFAALVEGGAREGWIALHAHDYRAAEAAFGDRATPRARAQFALSLLYEDLSDVSGLAHEQLFSEWEERGGLPEGNEILLLAALSSACTDGDTTIRWASRISTEPGLALAQALIQGRSAFEYTGSDPFGRRMALHRAAQAGDEAPLLEAATTPLITRKEETFVRRFWDPCLYRSLSDHWRRRVGETLGGSSTQAIASWSEPDAPLQSRLFAPWATASDLASDVASGRDPALYGARSPTLRRLGVGSDTEPIDDPEQARALMRLLDAGLARWREQLLALADEDGQALLEDLQLIHRFRQEWLVTRARLALDEDHPRQSLVYTEQARDHAQELGPANGPALLALLAETRLRLGHTREALDALHLLAQEMPEVLGLTEIVGDLAILRGLDRQGDSKENP